MDARRKKQVFLTVWLITPVVLAGSLYFLFPKDPGHTLKQRARSIEMAKGEGAAEVKTPASK